MNDPPSLILHNNRVCFSPSHSFSFRLSANFLFLTHSHTSRNLVLHGEGIACKTIVCCLGKAGHSFQARNGNHRRRHGKPGSSSPRKVKKKMMIQKEAGKEERVLTLESSQPSENCLSRLFEEQPLRLQNRSPSFQCISKESDILTQKTPRSFREDFDFFAYTNGRSQARYSDGNANLKPDFSTRLLEILSGSKKEGGLNDVKSTGILEFAEDNLEEVTMQRPPESEVVTSTQLWSRLVTDVEKQKFSGETSDECVRELVPSEIELNSYVQSDLSGEDIMDSRLIKEDIPQGALEETDFSSESSDDDGQNEVENSQGIHNLGNRLSEGNKMIQSEPFLPPYSKGQSFISPRHLSKSSGSRSSPSRSSIPGLRSKYSKPDPKAKQLAKRGQPLCLLPNFEVTTEGTDICSFRKDDLTSNTYSDREGEEQELEKCINFDWWDSDQDDDLNNDDSTTGVKSFKGRDLERPSKLHLKSDEDIESYSKSSKQTLKKPEECIDFEWSDSDEERDLGPEDSQLFEWSDSDAETGLKEERDTFRQRDSDARDKNGRENGLLSATTQHSVSSERKQQSTWSKQESGARPMSSFRPLTWYNREECEKYHSITRVDHKPFLDNELHQLPVSVKFLEVPPWKWQTLPYIPFEFQYSYSEIPKAPILGFRDHNSPFGPKTMERPWTGRPLVKPRRHLAAIQSFDPVLERTKSFELSFNRKWTPPKRVRSREEVLGQPLTDDEVKLLVRNCHVEKRQVNLGRDGLTHNMLHLIHTHWKRQPVCRIKCRGPPTLDMDNVCFHVEEKTGGQIIYRTGCVLYVFRGRHYSYKYRPVLPFMLYRPSSPVYPKLVPQAPTGLTIEEARQLRILGQKVKPLIKLRKNGAFPDLVRHVRDALMVDDLVSLDYATLKAGDYRKIGAKLRELVPCVLLSFRNGRIVLWRGRDANSSPHSSKLHVESARWASEPSAEVIDAEGSSITASESDISKEAMAGMAMDVGIQRVEKTSPLSQESKKENTQLHHLGDVEHACKDSLTESPVLEQHMQTRVEPHIAASEVVEKDVFEALSMYEKLDASWDTALKNGVAVELEGVDLEADLVLHLASAFSEVAPVGPKYTIKLLNKLRLQGVYEKSPKQFDVHFYASRETLSKWKRLHKQASHTPKVKRHPDTGLPVDALARILKK